MSQIPGFTLIMYGDTGAGKTPISATGPRPVLFFDVESRSRFIRAKKVYWNPLTEQPPQWDGEWEICVVHARDWRTVESGVDWVIAGKHPFKSVVLDSLTELQKRGRDDINAAAGDPTLSERGWGILLLKMESKIRALRDSTTHPDNAVSLVVMTALLDEKLGKYRPFLQGAMSKQVAAYADVIGYLYADEPEPGELPGPGDRRLLLGPSNQFITKDASFQGEKGTGIIGRHGAVVHGPITLSQFVNELAEDL